MSNQKLMDIILKGKNDTKEEKEIGFIVAIERYHIRAYIFIDKNKTEPIGYLDILKEDYDNFCLDILNTNRKIFTKDKEIQNGNRKNKQKA